MEDYIWTFIQILFTQVVAVVAWEFGKWLGRKHPKSHHYPFTDNVSFDRACEAASKKLIEIEKEMK